MSSYHDDRNYDCPATALGDTIPGKCICKPAPTPEQEGMRTGALPDWAKHNHPAQLAIREQARRAEAAEAKLEAMRGLLKRYRTEVHLGHQPHMIAHQVDELLEQTK